MAEASEAGEGGKKTAPDAPPVSKKMVSPMHL